MPGTPTLTRLTCRSVALPPSPPRDQGSHADPSRGRQPGLALIVLGPPDLVSDAAAGRGEASGSYPRRPALVPGAGSRCSSSRRFSARLTAHAATDQQTAVEPGGGMA
jgi:hypothetical protein